MVKTKEISDVNGTTFTNERNQTTENNSSLSVTQYEPYFFYNVPTEIEISKPSSAYSFRVQVIDSNDKIVSGQKVSILAYDVGYGEASSMSIVTDSNGFATFVFTSAKSLKGLTNKRLVLRLAMEHTGVKKEVSVNFKFK